MYEDSIIMYQIYTCLMSEHILKGIRSGRQKECKIEYVNGTPFVAIDNGASMFGSKRGKTMISIEGEMTMFIFQLFSAMVNLFCANKYGISRHCFQLISIRNNESDVNIDIEWNAISGKILGCNAFACVYKLGDLLLYEMVDGNVDRLLLLLFIDPQAFISRMKGKINGSAMEVQEFFDDIGSGVNGISRVLIAKYFLLKQLEYKRIVNDVVFLIVDMWMALEIVELEIMMKYDALISGNM